MDQIIPQENTEMKSRLYSRNDRIVLLLCGLIFVVSASLCIWSGNHLKYGDERVYTQIAQRLVGGLGYVDEALQPSADRPPGYPFAVSLAFRVHASVLSAKLMNAVALAATAWLLSLIVKIISPSGEVFAPLLVFAYPLFTYTSSLLYPQMLGGLFFVLAMYLILKYPASSIAGMVCGASYGALILMIPAFVLVGVSIFALLLVRNMVDRLYSRRFLTLFVVTAVFVVSLWILRCSLLFDRFVFISTNSGINLLYGNSENTKYNTGVVDISQYAETAGLNEAELDSYYRSCAKKWVVEHPAQAAQLYLQKTANYFHFRNKLSTVSEASPFKDILMGISYYPLLLIVILRAMKWRTFRFSWPEFLLYAIYFGNAFLSAVVYTRIRYRIPFDFLLLAMVAIFIGNLRRHATGKVA